MPLLYLGATHLLRAQLRAADKSVLSAAYEAKKARKLLLRASSAGGSRAESAFGLGTYEYFAASLPSVIRGLRFLLFLPGGDRQRGLGLLELSATDSDLFGFEARAVLVSIYGNDDERQFDKAVRHAGLLLSHENRAVTALYAAAKLDMQLARPSSAWNRLEEAEEKALGSGDASPSVIAAIRYLKALADIRRFMFGSGVLELERILADRTRVPRNLERKSEKLLQTYRPLAGSPEEHRLQQIRAMLIEGDRPPDPREFSRLAEEERLPASVRRQCRLLAGQVYDLAGNRTAALGEYRQVEREPASRLYRTRPFTKADGF